MITANLLAIWNYNIGLFIIINDAIVAIYCSIVCCIDLLLFLILMKNVTYLFMQSYWWFNISPPWQKADPLVFVYFDVHLYYIWNQKQWYPTCNYPMAKSKTMLAGASWLWQHQKNFKTIFRRTLWSQEFIKKFLMIIVMALISYLWCMWIMFAPKGNSRILWPLMDSLVKQFVLAKDTMLPGLSQLFMIIVSIDVWLIVATYLML